tara:strand:- start:639 stop:1811 length:1173 start_codon:yes stop_codon:yes gene_type:complete
MRYEFTIFGSGISAKVTSCLLAKNGFKVCLISDKDPNKEVSNTNLVTFLSAGSVNYLSSMFTNIQLFSKYPEIQTINCHLNDFSLNKSQSVTFNHEEKKPLGKIIRNNDLEKFLEEEIKKLKNINTVFSNRPQIIENNKNGIKLKIEKDEEIKSDLFILSSANKNITKQIEIDFVKKDLEQQAFSINVEGDIKNENCAFQKFTSDGPLAILPYSHNEASVVWSIKNNSKLLLKSSTEFHQVINKHLNEQISSVKITSIEKHKLKFVYAKNLYYKNILLLGNIAHNIHPIAGQGLNLSIKDISLFVKQMTKYISLGYRANDQIALEEFEINRKLDNTVYSFGTLSLNDIFSSNNKFVNFTARKGLNLVDKSRFLKQLFINSATGNDFFKSL